MKRWKVKYKDGCEILLYSDDNDRFLKENDVIDVKIYEDKNYMEYINKIIKKCKKICEKKHNRNITEIYYFENLEFSIYIRLYKDSNDNVYYDYSEYQENKKYSLVYPVGYVMSNPEKVWKKINIENMNYVVYSHRFYYEPKLKKPKELKGIKSIGSAMFIPKKCNPSVFLKDDDIYIKHTDFFSPSWRPPKGEVLGNDQSYYLKKYFNTNKSTKFVYGDNFADIVLREEAWILLKNSVHLVKKSNNCLDFVRIVIQQMKKDKLYILQDSAVSEWERFWSSVYNVVKNQLRGS